MGSWGGHATSPLSPGSDSKTVIAKSTLSSIPKILTLKLSLTSLSCGKSPRNPELFRLVSPGYDASVMVDQSSPPPLGRNLHSPLL